MITLSQSMLATAACCPRQGQSSILRAQRWVQGLGWVPGRSRACDVQPDACSPDACSAYQQQAVQLVLPRLQGLEGVVSLGHSLVQGPRLHLADAWELRLQHLPQLLHMQDLSQYLHRQDARGHRVQLDFTVQLGCMCSRS